MLETVTWMDLIINSLRLKLDADPGYLPTFLHELDKIMAQVRSDSSNGFKRCKLVFTRQQVVDGMCMVHVINPCTLLYTHPVVRHIRTSDEAA